MSADRRSGADGSSVGASVGAAERAASGDAASVRAPASVRPYAVALEPPFWARGGHAQTIGAHLWPCKAPRIEAGSDGFERVEIELEGGDSLVALARDGTSGVVVHVWHGLSGDANADYVRRAVQVARARGHGVWAVNHRGQGAGAGLARGTYHSGRSDDLAAVLRASRERAPTALHVLVGFSMSGNAGLLLAADATLAPPDALVAVNPPVDLAQCSDLIQRGPSRLYERRFVNRLRRELVRRERAGLLDVPVLVERGMSLRDLDDLHTAPAGGFEDADDYYARCSALPHLENVRVPTVVVTAADDPFVDARAFGRVKLPQAVTLHVEPVGGHVGYLARRGLGATFWLDGALGHYLDELVAAAGRGATAKS
jgi:uncharacterized protein